MSKSSLTPHKNSFFQNLLAFVGRYGFWFLPALATILTLCSTWLILGPVLNRSGDNIYHMLNQYAIARGIMAGDNPLGPLGMEFGQPLLRFYQCLFYLWNVSMYFVTGLDLRFLHNLTIVVCFGFSPFTYTYFLKKLGVNPWTAGFGGFLSMISVAAFGNSFEAYHQAGIVTQSMGGLFFPWFMGNYIGMLRGENKPTSTGLLFAIAFLSHAIMSVFAVFAGGLYFLVSKVDIWGNVKRVAIFCVVGASLVAFWVLPFIAHTNELRAVPDSIIRGAGVHWFTSVSRAELNMVLGTGRLLDDAKKLKEEKDANDKFMDKISIIGTLKTRPPVFTLVTALGCLVALLGFRRTSRRFLAAGFAFSLMLFAGPDDFSWLRFLPFMKHIQTFRCTYLIEFFAFGLCALAGEAVIGGLFRFARTRKRKWSTILGFLLWAIFAGSALGGFGTEIVALGQVHLRIRPTVALDSIVDAAKNIPNKGYPFRISPKHKGRNKRRQAWLAVHGYQPYCTHWKGVGPSSAYHLCRALGSPSNNMELNYLAGVRWVTGDLETGKDLITAKDALKTPVFEKIPNGKDRRGQKNGNQTILDLGNEHFLRPLLSTPLPVVCTHSQWIWITKTWIGQTKNNLFKPETHLTMRVRAGELNESGLLADAPALFYFDHSNLEKDLPALKAYAQKGGLVISPRDIPMVKTVLTNNDKPWTLLPKSKKVTPKPKQKSKIRKEYEELNPGLEVTAIKFLKPRKNTFQNFTFDVDALVPVNAVLPMENFPGWSATLNGKPWPVFSAGPDMVGVRLPQGAHRLAFKWRIPTWHLLSVYLSLFGVLIVIASWIMGARKRLMRR